MVKLINKTICTKKEGSMLLQPEANCVSYKVKFLQTTCFSM